MSENKELLEVKDLGITFFTDRGALPAVQEVSFSIKPGETLGVVGESGCGKSMTALSLMQLIPSPPGKITAGEIMYKGEDLLKKSPKEMRDIRGKEISMIFQEPMTSLNPVITVGKQIMEAVLTHENMSKQEAKERALEILKAKLYDMEVQKQTKEITDLRRSQVGSGDRSERIRTYNFPQGRLTDHRLNHNLNVWTVIDGELDELIDLLVEYDQKLKLEKLAQEQ